MHRPNKEIMYMERLHHFCNIHITNDGLRSSKSTKKQIHNGRFINQFMLDIKTLIC